jgi:hypothetical protein
VKFKPQDVFREGKGALVIAYIDVRLVIERLNLLVPDLWADSYRDVSANTMWCDLTVDGITRSDVGEGSGKGLVSDALKRAAVHFGVGVSLYAVPAQKLWAGEHLETWKAGGTKPNGEPRWAARITDAGERVLRDGYTAWLTSTGTKTFGQPIDHGDVEGAQGDAELESQPDADEVGTLGPGAVVAHAGDRSGLWDFVRAAIRSKDKKRYPDDAQWAKAVEQYESGGDPAFPKRLADEMTDLGIDPEAVKARWKELR